MGSTTENKDYMGMALAEAEAAARAGEVPVGAVIVGPTGAVSWRAPITGCAATMTQPPMPKSPPFRRPARRLAMNA